MTRVDYMQVIIPDYQVTKFKEMFSKSIIDVHKIIRTEYSIIVIKRICRTKLLLYTSLVSLGFIVINVSNTKTKFNFKLYDQIVQNNTLIVRKCNKMYTN